MKTWFIALILTATVAVAERPPIRDVSEFYEPLSAHGYWIQHERGWCWHPERVAADWRPFANGHWLWTTNGWYWESPEPWAWATYHYGRWFWDEREGWLWLPDTEWVPASTVEPRAQAAPPPPPVVQHYTYIERIEPIPIWYFHIERVRDCRPPPPACCRNSPCDRHRPRPRCDTPPRPRCETPAPAPTPRQPPARLPEQPAPTQPRVRPPARQEQPVASPPARPARPQPAPAPVVSEPVVAKKTFTPRAEAYREQMAQRKAEKLAKIRD